MKIASILPLAFAAGLVSAQDQDQQKKLDLLNVILQGLAPQQQQNVPAFVAPAPAPQANLPQFVPDIAAVVDVPSTISTATLIATSAAAQPSLIQPATSAAQATPTTTASPSPATSASAIPIPVPEVPAVTTTVAVQQPAPTTEAPAPEAPAPDPQPVPAPEPAPAPQPDPQPEPQPQPEPVQPVQPQQPQPVTGDACAYIINSILPNYSDSSNSPSDAQRLHNEIRGIIAQTKGINLASLSWSDSVASFAAQDAQWSVANSNCLAGGLAHWSNWGAGVHAKSLGWSSFITSIKMFVTYDDGRGTECSQYVNYGTSNHFANIVSDSTTFGCGAYPCGGGGFGAVVGCDYA
ncbi:hypothetical protein HDU80_011473 [Chytriomyces hyalinus]|nr:hypothetical protein HDU80_011473 [Chytriomyces hyalinus]